MTEKNFKAYIHIMTYYCTFLSNISNKFKLYNTVLNLERPNFVIINRPLYERLKAEDFIAYKTTIASRSTP